MTTTTTDPFAAALDALGLATLPDAPGLERAYREATLAHAPDQDPDGFQRVREAYELLQNPFEAGRRALVQPTPLVGPPRLPQRDPHARGELSVCLLRASARHVSARALLAPPEPASPTP